MKTDGRAFRMFRWLTNFLFDDFRRVFFAPKPALAEERIPCNKNGEPDLSYYTEPLEHYVDLYTAFLNTKAKGSTRGQQVLAWKQRVHGTWGLLAKGPDALPFLLTLIRHSNPAAREDGAHLLGELKSDTATNDYLLACLQNEDDLVARSAIIGALGKLRYRPAIPALASLILNKDIDIDMRWNAADSLALILGQDFSGPDKLRNAEVWLAQNEPDFKNH